MNNKFNGIIPLYKPVGMTSFDCVSRLRKIVHMKKIGHSGTLDPNVDGVLPICLGNATKVVDYLMDSGKVYQGSITIGFSTTTEDLDGDIVEQKELNKPLSNEEIDLTLSEFIGEIIQIPPMFSAVKVKGKRLYEYAREGLEVERPRRKAQIDYFKQIKDSTYDSVKKQQTIYFEVGCGKGTYVRTLAVDFGKKLNYPAVMSKLTRIKSGGFSINQTYTFNQIEDEEQKNTLDNILQPISYALINYKEYNLSDDEWNNVKNGGWIKINQENILEDTILLKYQKEAKALYRYHEENNCYKPLKMFSTN
ncbi:tRNA pseudouridine(55) synthase TruB [Lactobacillus sp. S2-2]|uniref:tRNA pseudouridine(55) synthase TruB n=1 Tax=Lactobacillus sp. S2-2 TaxID=2692917 RepID=UPI001EFFE56E|nr:tRNA pseudouridine(55) synthase TruB [Lactobacillus sp. S2-2]MCF6514954.1 tRNA pseudouridine(55) synthase TruB [Lactobacillus sp. S2-2]